MWATYIGILNPGVEDHLGEYYDRPFEVFESYYETDIYRLSGKWIERLGPSRQMDWGSWLYICDRKTLHELMNIRTDSIIPIIPAEKNDGISARREAPIPLKELPKRERYGILEAELW